jgi:cell filamentation protein
MPESSDPYTYPGTEVLRNIPDIRDSQRLADFEANATTARLAELGAIPLKGRFDVAHLKAIHKYIFQDVYSWAGEFRTVNVSRARSDRRLSTQSRNVLFSAK